MSGEAAPSPLPWTAAPRVPSRLPWVGPGLSLLRDPTAWFQRQRERVGDTYVFETFGYRVVGVFSPEGVKNLWALPEAEIIAGPPVELATAGEQYNVPRVPPPPTSACSPSIRMRAPPYSEWMIWMRLTGAVSDSQPSQRQVQSFGVANMAEPIRAPPGKKNPPGIDCQLGNQVRGKNTCSSTQATHERK